MIRTLKPFLQNIKCTNPQESLKRQRSNVTHKLNVYSDAAFLTISLYDYAFSR